MQLKTNYAEVQNMCDVKKEEEGFYMALVT